MIHKILLLSDKLLLTKIFILLIISLLTTPIVLAQTFATGTPNPNVERRRAQEAEQVIRRSQEQSPSVAISIQNTQPTGHFELGEQPCYPIQGIQLHSPKAEDAKVFEWLLSTANRADDEADDAPIGLCLGARGINLIVS